MHLREGRNLFWAGVLAALLAGVSGVWAAVGERNLVTNGDFEAGAEGWRLTSQILTDPRQAHSGEKCVFGEVTAPNQAHFIRRTFALREKNLYRLVFWARATNRTKVAVWIRTGEERRNLAQLKNIPVRWRQCVVPFSVPHDGDWELEIVAPSSHGAPVGKMWVDDVALYEVELPLALNLTEDEGLSEDPALAVDGRGQAFCAWVAFENGRDHVRMAYLADPAATTPTVTQRWEVPLPEHTAVGSLALAGAREGAWLVVASEVGGNWDLYLARITAAGPSPVQPLTTEAATDIHPSLAVAGERVWVAWESNRDGSRQIYALQVTNGRVAPPQRLSTGDTSNYNPSIVAQESGQVWVVWESFREDNYDLYLAHFDGNAWQSEQRLTTDPRLEHRPVVALGPNGLWLAWEVVWFNGYRTSNTPNKRVLVARWTPEGLQAPANIWEAFPAWVEQPTLAVDPTGRVWAAVRQSRGQHGSWDVTVQVFTGSAWTAPRQLTSQPGRARRAPLALVGDLVLVAAQVDNVPGSWPNAEAAQNVRSNVVLSRLSQKEVPPAVPLQLRALQLPETEFNLAPLRAEFGEEAPRRSIEYRGQRLWLFYGQFHEHSDISVCNRRGDLCPEDNYAHERDINRLDFAALTDHGYNFSPHLWHYAGKLARWQHDPGRFVTFLAEEWTSSFEEYTAEHPYGFYGHRNLIFADPYFPQWYNSRDRTTPAELWAQLRRMGVNFIHIPHQLADTGNVPTDWNFVDEEAQPVAEIFQARGSYEYKGTPRQARRSTPKPGYFLQDAWAKGVVIGVIASPDHGGGMGKAAVYAPELTREAILDACRARRTYGTTAAKIFLDVRVNGHLMGERVPATEGPVTVHIEVAAPNELAFIEVCRNNQFIYTKETTGREEVLDFRDTNPLPNTAYYYVRVRLQDGEIAWSSPVWLVRE